MADESSDEELNVQNGYDGELELYLAGNSESDTSDSAGNFFMCKGNGWRKQGGIIWINV